MKKVLLIISVALCFCTATIPRENHRVKTAIHYLYKGNDTSEYFYNSDGHIAYMKNKGVINSLGDINNPLMILTEGPFTNSIYEYEYKSDRVIRRRHYAKPQTYIIDKNGMAINILTDNSSNQRREYNSQKQLTRIWFEGLAVSDTVGYLNGNPTLITGGFKWVARYDTLHFNTIGHENFGEDYWGADTKNPIISYSIQFVGEAPINVTYNYHYDDKGRITVKVLYDKTGTQIDSIFYTYY